MVFPVRKQRQIASTHEIVRRLGVNPRELYSERDLVVLLDSQQEVRDYIPDYAQLKKLGSWLGIVITANGDDADFVSRYFCPELMSEDGISYSRKITERFRRLDGTRPVTNAVNGQLAVGDNVLPLLLDMGILTKEMITNLTGRGSSS